MAVDTQAFRLLLSARCAGADFSRTLTFGRQSYFPKPSHARRAITASGLSLDADALTALSHSYAEPFLTALGAQSVDSMDASDYEHATIVHDLNRPVPEHLHGSYSAVFDGGTTEHVYHFSQAIDNAIRLLAPGGHFISITTGNNLPGHGFFQISPELFFRVFSAANGFKIHAVLLTDIRPGRPFYRVADPADIRGRVEYTSRRPFYVAVIAQKVVPVETLRVLPLQSDYQATWSAGDTTSSSKLTREIRRLRAQARSFIGRHFYFPWQNRGITALSDRELYSL